MRVESGFVPAQLLERETTAPLKNLHFSKDAEIAEKTIKLATAAFSRTANLNDVFARRGVGLIANFTMRRAANACAASPAAQKSFEREFDGHFVGADGQTFLPQTALENVRAVEPANGARVPQTLIYINGINTDKDRQAATLERIAEKTDARVVGVYNATQNALLDATQSSSDKSNICSNPAVNTLAGAVYDEIKAERGAHLFAHSQGAIIASRALTDVYNRLRLEDGLSKKDAQNLMSNINVETFGGAARRYPDGPQYVHYVNRRDAVPQLFDLRQFLNPFADAGRGAITRRFSAGDGISTHGLEDVYLPKRVPFEQARRSEFD